MIIVIIILLLNLNISLQPKQIQLYKLVSESGYGYIAYGGAGGGAKSHAVRDVALIIASEIPNINIGIFRRLSKELLTNHIIPFFRKYPELRIYFNKTERILYLPSGSTIQFCSSDDEEAIYSYKGSEFDLEFVDEATHFTPDMIQFLKTRNRSSKPNFKAKMILTCNPGNISHAYIKRLYIDRNFEDNENPDDYIFLPAKIYDNVIWSTNELKARGFTVKDYYEKWTDEERRDFTLNYSEYAKTLQGLPEQLKKAYLEGDWDVFGGQFFKSANWVQMKIPPFKIQPEWKLIGSLDPGFSSPCSFGLTAQDLAGNTIRISTYYEAERSPEEHAEAIKDFISNCPYTEGRKPSIIVSGRDAFAKKDRYAIMANDKTLADVFSAYGLYLHPAKTDRVQGWWAWKALIPNKYSIFDIPENKPLIDEMQAVISDDRHVEDIQGRGNDPSVSDHALDEQRYGIMALDKPIDTESKTNYLPNNSFTTYARI